ncbi:putative Carbohydrate kinase, FGGY [uncultured spirochete]|jgi:xylulokinase|uniref:Putative Carbohydrate kinase, FGGY n=1 Tax=uncultured spirochete TaxID=156406 RepID=A0A3P3XIS0_9SPIR|nr:FGGY family carbohydrate kinase [Rectinema subterraneum]SLM12820.1 putative Carbohydrate kinase, FGGY [uncultured spirochete]
MSQTCAPLHIGIDLGTGSLKLSAYAGERAFSASCGYDIFSPEPGIAETDPEAWIAALKTAWLAVCAQLQNAGLPIELASIGLSAQMHGFVPISETGAALHNAILWADLRGAAYAGLYSSLLAGSFDRLMNAPAAGLTALILLWMKHHEPELYAKTHYILFPKDYLRFRLTGDIATDPGDASASLLYDFRTCRWAEDAIEALGMDHSKLPVIRDSFSPGGVVTGKASRETGLPEGVLVATGSADKACEIYGSGFFGEYFRELALAGSPDMGIMSRQAPARGKFLNSAPLRGTGMNSALSREDMHSAPFRGHDSDWQSPKAAQVSIGTGIQVVIPVRGLAPYEPGLNFFESCVPSVRYRMAAMLNGGLALEWVLSMLNADWESLYRAMDEGKTRLPQDLLFLPYLTGERSPYQNPDARGAWIGLGLHHTRNDLLSAALLGVACTIRLGMESLGVAPDASVYCVGGSTRFKTWMNIVSEVTGRALFVTDQPDASVRGAAAIGRAAAETGAFDARRLPAPLETTRIEAESPAWIEHYYSRFKSSYEALFGGHE